LNKILPSVLLAILAFVIWNWRNQILIQGDDSMPVLSVSPVSPSPSPVTTARRSRLNQLAEFERQKIKVVVEHDNTPSTNTYPMILDATGSYDPDLGDKIFYRWYQINGPEVDLKPSNTSAKVSFEGVAGEYEFELTVSDNYGAQNTIRKTVVIEPEPNIPPVIDIKVRQGSELK